MKNLKSLLKNENGNMMVMLAISMVVLLGAVAMVVDIGRLYHEKSVLQNAVDAAALGGAHGLVVSEAHAKTIAQDLAVKNLYPTNDITFPTSDSIKVSRETTVPMTFAKVLGINEAKISATAIAEVGISKSTKGVRPVAIEKSMLPGEPNYTVETPLKCEKGKYSPGNCGFLDIGTNGASGLAEAIIEGSKTPISAGSSVDTEPGQKWGPVKSAFETLISKDNGKAHCNTPDKADNSCERVIILPIIDSWNGINGKKSVKIIGFSSYWVKDMEEVDNSTKRITGHFIKMVSSGEIGGTEGSLYGVKLVE